MFWLGDEFVKNADAEAKALNFTQEQVDAAMRNHIWQVKWLFTAESHSWRSRVILALYFLTGWKPK